MCGIAGHVDLWASSSLGMMAKAISHRGPDGSGIWQNKDRTAGLAHSRLAITDLSIAGHQPMWDASGRFCLTYNGEIYNYRALGMQLERQGVVFKGNSDAEVLIEAYARNGVECLARLNGIFAFAVWDSHERTMTLVRDGLGVKPLYVTSRVGGMAFSSELKALSGLPDLDKRLNPSAIAAYLGLAYSPGSATPFLSINKVRTGSAITYDEQGEISSEYVFYSRPTGPVDIISPWSRQLAR